jgi:hypothetical protein
MGVRLRLGLVVISLSTLALAVAGERGAALLVLLVGVVVSAAAGLQAVAEVVDGERTYASAALSALALGSLVAAGALRRPELAAACLVVAALQEVSAPGLDRVRPALRR